MGTDKGEGGLRPPIDLVAEGMWQIAAGEQCTETWTLLPEDQRVWWRGCADGMIKQWFEQVNSRVR